MNINDIVYHKYFEGPGTVTAINGDTVTVVWTKTNADWQHPVHTLKYTPMPQIWKSKGTL